MKTITRLPWHRRTLDEECEVCGAAKNVWCRNQTTKDDRRTIRLHRYFPEMEMSK